MKREVYPRPSLKSPYKTLKIWCPYCKKWTKLVRRNYYKRTDCCGVSSMDFELRKYNHGF